MELGVEDSLDFLLSLLSIYGIQRLFLVFYLTLFVTVEEHPSTQEPN